MAKQTSLLDTLLPNVSFTSAREGLTSKPLKFRSKEVITLTGLLRSATWLDEDLDVKRFERLLLGGIDEFVDFSNMRGFRLFSRWPKLTVEVPIIDAFG